MRYLRLLPHVSRYGAVHPLMYNPDRLYRPLFYANSNPFQLSPSDFEYGSGPFRLYMPDLYFDRVSCRTTKDWLPPRLVCTLGHLLCLVFFCHRVPAPYTHAFGSGPRRRFLSGTIPSKPDPWLLSSCRRNIKYPFDGDALMRSQNFCGLVRRPNFLIQLDLLPRIFLGIS